MPISINEHIGILVVDLKTWSSLWLFFSSWSTENEDGYLTFEIMVPFGLLES